jgi:hypothetical protein
VMFGITSDDYSFGFRNKVLRLSILTLLITGWFSQLNAQKTITDGMTVSDPFAITKTDETRLTHRKDYFISSDNKGDKPYIRLAAGYSVNSDSFDQLVIYFDINATYNFDGQFDALKLFNTDLQVTNFYSFGNDSSRLSINSLPLTYENHVTIRLGLKTERDGDIIFKILDIVGDFQYKQISLSDMVTGVEQDLLIGNQYSVSLQEGHYQDRFYLNLSNISVSNSDDYDNKAKTNIYSFHGTLFARIDIPDLKDAWLSVFNLSGQVLYKYKINGPGEYQFNPELRNGLYIISFSSGSLRTTKKLYFHN